jgi:hypothetical protein
MVLLYPGGQTYGNDNKKGLRDENVFPNDTILKTILGVSYGSNRKLLDLEKIMNLKIQTKKGVHL